MIKTFSSVENDMRIRLFTALVFNTIQNAFLDNNNLINYYYYFISNGMRNDFQPSF